MFVESIVNAGHLQVDRGERGEDARLSQAAEGDGRGETFDPSRRDLKKKVVMTIPKSDRAQMRLLNQKRKV